MTVRDQILQGVRAWFKAALNLTNAQIIPADDKGPRPPLPYLTVRVSAGDTPTSVDEHRHADDGAGGVQWRTRGERSAVVDVQGYDIAGATTTAGWIEDAALRITRPDVAAVLDAAGLSVVDRGSTVDVSALLDSQIERRHLRTFELGYTVRDTGTGSPAVELVEAAITMERYRNHPDPLIVEIEIDTT